MKLPTGPYVFDGLFKEPKSDISLLIKGIRTIRCSGIFLSFFVCEWLMAPLNTCSAINAETDTPTKVSDLFLERRVLVPAKNFGTLP